jgi:glycosyltransferase involved in cell wall biosynthesis
MNIGGPAVQVTGLMRGINNMQFNQKLVTGFCDSSERDYLDEVASDVVVTRIGNFGRKVNILGDFRVLIALVKVIREFRPQIIHTHTAKAGVLGRLASIISLQPAIRVHTYHGHLLQGYFGKIRTFLIIKIEHFLAFSTTQLLSVGNNVQNDLLNAGIGTAEKFQNMPPGLKLPDLKNREYSRLALGLPEEGVICAFIGRVTKIKRPDRFLDVVALLANEQKNLQFLIVGDGELMDYCAQRIFHEKLPVLLLGWQSKIENVLSAVDIVVLTSDNEGMPLSLIEAGMAKLPVVSCDVGSVEEVVDSQITGYITNTFPRNIADAVATLAKSASLREQMGEKAYDHTILKFGVNRLVSDHEALYRKLLLESFKAE